MDISINRAIHLKHIVGKRIRELLEEREKVSVVNLSQEDFQQFNEGGLALPRRTFEDVTKELEVLRKDELEISLALSKANINYTIDWKGEDIPLGAALTLVKQLRGELDSLQKLYRDMEVTLTDNIYRSAPIYEVVLYDTGVLEEVIQELRKDVDSLSSLLNEANFKHKVFVSCAGKYFSS